jgi:hypothetical protein
MSSILLAVASAGEGQTVVMDKAARPVAFAP